MNQTKKPYMLERIKESVRPLTDNDGFQLKTVAYGLHNSVYLVELSSKDITVFFRGKNVTRYPQTVCGFFSHLLEKFFFTQYLFPAMNLEIPLSAKGPLFDLGSSNHVTGHGQKYPLTELDVLNFYEDLERWCLEIQKNLRKIRSYFETDSAAETIRRYSFQVLKYGNNQDIFLLPYPVSGPETFQAEYFGKPDIDFTDILTALRPLHGLTERDTITIHLGTGRLDITTYMHDHFCKLLFHTTSMGTIGCYFIFPPWNHLRQQYPELQDDKKQVVFSADNIMKSLNIGYSCHPKGILDTIQEYCQNITENSKKIRDAFSGKSIEIAYNELKKVPGNNEDEINRVLANLNDLCD